jgi:hypothetical protein
MAKRGGRTFSQATLVSIDKAKIIGIRAGDSGHRFTGVWVVVVDGRVFIRSWTVKKSGWFSAFLQNPRGAISLGRRELRVRAARTRSERLKREVGAAYASKYDTPGARKYVRGFRTRRRRDATLELLPR